MRALFTVNQSKTTLRSSEVSRNFQSIVKLISHHTIFRRICAIEVWKLIVIKLNSCLNSRTHSQMSISIICQCLNASREVEVVFSQSRFVLTVAVPRLSQNTISCDKWKPYSSANLSLNQIHCYWKQFLSCQFTILFIIQLKELIFSKA